MANNENIIYGRNPVRESLRSHKAVALYISDSFDDEEMILLAKKDKICIKRCSYDELKKFAGGANSQGCAAKVKPYEYSCLQNIIGLSKREKNPIIVVLDGIEDPHNLGAILRSADVFGVTGIIISKHHQVPLNSTVAKTSAGAINFVPVGLVNNINQALKELKEEGFWVVATDGNAETNYQDIDYNFPTVLVIGSEGKGVSSLVKKNSDYLVKIPMYGKVNSLNASVATGVLLSKIKG